MKQIIKLLLLVVAFCVTYTIGAQDQKTLFEEWGSTDLMCLYGGAVEDGYAIELKDMDDPYLWNVTLKNKYLEGSTYYAPPTEQPHPTQLFLGTVFDKDFKYYRSYNSLGIERRLLIVGDFLYKMQKEGSKGKWKVDKVFVKGKFKILKIGKVMKRSKEVENTDHDQLIQAYLDKENILLKQKTPAYNQQNAAFLSTFREEELKAKGDREESLKQAWEARVGSAVRVVNNKPYNITIAVGSNSSGRTVKPGDTETFACDLADLYLVNPSGKKTFLLKPRSYCGKKYTLN